MTDKIFRTSRGLSLVETTIILSMLSILSAVATPSIGDYISDARMVKARADVQTIASSVSRFVFDVGGTGRLAGGWATYDLLVGDGATPSLGPNGEDAWLRAVDAQRVGLLSEHLVTNSAHYPARPSGASLAMRGWRGPYLEAGVGSDPWGYRYAVNVGALAERGSFTTIVLSSGPNGADDTGFSSDDFVHDRDDVIGLIGGGR